MTVYEMIQHHKEVKKEIRQSGISIKADKAHEEMMRAVSHQLSASQKAHKEQRQTMRKVTHRRLSSVFETLPLIHKSSQPGKHHKVIPISGDAASKTAVESTDSTPNILLGPPSASPQAPAEVRAEHSVEPTAAAAPALSAMQQNLWNKAEQVFWESDSVDLLRPIALQYLPFRMVVLVTHTIYMMLFGKVLHT